MCSTIYGVALEGIGNDAKIGASGLIMAILGGALFPLAQGWVATNTTTVDAKTGVFIENFTLSYLVPLTCFFVVGVYGFFVVKRTQRF